MQDTHKLSTLHSRNASDLARPKSVSVRGSNGYAIRPRTAQMTARRLARSKRSRPFRCGEVRRCMLTDHADNAHDGDADADDDDGDDDDDDHHHHHHHHEHGHDHEEEEEEMITWLP
eukprot:170851-Rhodomonas_salina.1